MLQPPRGARGFARQPRAALGWYLHAKEKTKKKKKYIAYTLPAYSEPSEREQVADQH